ncbi:hypothetical protein NC651_026911 [Populus alba x Populus x berolinensis]|nr:hypothetical protein NC651_026911 [Populus alba x Populus x berolinensis]
MWFIKTEIEGYSLLDLTNFSWVLKVLKIWCTGKKCSMLSMEECKMRRKTGKRKGGGGDGGGDGGGLEERKLESITFNLSHPKLFDNKI